MLTKTCAPVPVRAWGQLLHKHKVTQLFKRETCSEESSILTSHTWKLCTVDPTQWILRSLAHQMKLAELRDEEAPVMCRSPLQSSWTLRPCVSCLRRDCHMVSENMNHSQEAADESSYHHPHPASFLLALPCGISKRTSEISLSQQLNSLGRTNCVTLRFLWTLELVCGTGSFHFSDCSVDHWFALFPYFSWIIFLVGGGE